MISGINPMEVGKSATRALQYQPQVNTPADDDPDNYMMLVPASKLSTIYVIYIIIYMDI